MVYLGFPRFFSVFFGSMLVCTWCLLNLFCIFVQHVVVICFIANGKRKHVLYLFGVCFICICVIWTKKHNCALVECLRATQARETLLYIYLLHFSVIHNCIVYQAVLSCPHLISTVCTTGKFIDSGEKSCLYGCAGCLSGWKPVWNGHQQDRSRARAQSVERRWSGKVVRGRENLFEITLNTCWPPTWSIEGGRWDIGEAR